MDWFVRDICGYVCIFFTYLTLTVVELGLIFFSLKPRLLQGDLVAYFHLIVFNCIIALITTSHIRCVTTNPGTLPKQDTLQYKKLPLRTKEVYESVKGELSRIPQGKELIARIDENFERKGSKKKHKQNQNQEEKQLPEAPAEDQKLWNQGVSLLKIFEKRCKKCESMKPPKSHHCSTCKACVARMDHHCPWVNNCVGYTNQKFFLLFMMYVVVGCCYAGFFFYHRVRTCSRINRFCGVARDMKMLVLALLNLFLLLLFVLFCVVMSADQLHCILTERSTIDKLQKGRKVGARRSMRENLQRVFGGKFGISWILPVRWKREIIMEEEY